MLALTPYFGYSMNKRKLQKQTNSKKIQKNFLLVVANAIRYPPQHEITRFGGFFRGFKKPTTDRL